MLGTKWLSVLAAGLALTACQSGPGPAVAPASTPAAAVSPTTPATGRPVVRPPRSAAEAAADVMAAERAIGDPHTSHAQLRATGRLQQVAYREWSTRPEWDRAVRSALPERFRRLAADNVAARRALRSIYPTQPAALPHVLPAWRIARAVPEKLLLAAYHRADRRYGVDWSYLAAINLVETDLGRIHGTSEAGAQGPMQFEPATWAAYGAGGDIHSATDSILAAARLLRANGFTRPGGRTASLYHYNNSTGYVRGVSLIAGILAHRPRAFAGYYQWRVYYLTDRGSILLPEGYDEPRPVPVDRWLATN